MPLERLALLSLLGFAFPAAAQFEGRIVSPDGALEGVVSILEGMNPRILEEKLLGFLVEAEKKVPAPEATSV